MSETNGKEISGQSDTHKPSVQRLDVLAQSCEILAVLFFTSGWILLYSKPNWLSQSQMLLWGIPSLLFAASVALFVCAVVSTYRSNQNAERTARTIKYVITPQRIETLKAARVPKDVRGYLGNACMGQSFSKEELLSQLEEALGPERTDEVKSVVLKYTKIYEPSQTSATQTTVPEKVSMPAEVGADHNPSPA
jgi:hypothetical protein